ncbi:MAG TPA: hypothetical protein VF589_13480 [Allosphingosinicella sp.]|jgi:hypothetical protein
MYSLALVSALLVSAAAQGQSGSPLKAYANCLNDVVRSKLEQATDPAAFETALASACPAEAAAYRGALVRKEMEFGTSREEADKFAADEVSAYLVDMKKLYQSAHATNVKSPAAPATATPAATPAAQQTKGD